MSSDGIDVLFSQATVSQNDVSNNECRPSDPLCGPDFFNLFQHIGIFAGGPGTVVTRNLVHGNQVGIYAVDGGTFNDNVTWDDDFFDMTFQDGSFTPAGDRLAGPGGGAAVVASKVDSDATFTHARFFGTSGAPIQTFDCCGFTATGSLTP